MANELVVRIIGDSKSLEKAFARSAKSAQTFNRQMNSSGTGRYAKEVREVAKAENELVKVRSKKALSLGPFRLAGVGLGAGLGLFAATTAVRELGNRLEVTGQAAFTTEGRLRNMASALSSGNFVGAISALAKTPKTFEQMGWSIEEVRKRQAALQKVADGTARAYEHLTPGVRAHTAEMSRAAAATKAAGGANQEQAKNLLSSVAAFEAASTAAEGYRFTIERLGQTMVTQSGAVVRWKGAVDDLVRAGRGEAVSGVQATTGPTFTPGLTPSQRRELALTGQQGAARLPGLRDRLRQLENMRKAALTNEQLLKAATEIASTEAEIAAIMADIAAARTAAAAAAKAAAEAARQQRLATQLGWLQFATERAEATKGIKDDRKALRAEEKYWKDRIRAEGRKLELVQELWRTQQRIRDLNKAKSGDPLAGLMQVSTKRLTGILAAGTGLGAGGRRVLGANISGAQIQTYVNVSLDGQQVAKSVTVQQKRGGNRTGNQTSGRRG